MGRSQWGPPTRPSSLAIFSGVYPPVLAYPWVMETTTVTPEPIVSPEPAPSLEQRSKNAPTRARATWARDAKLLAGELYSGSVVMKLPGGGKAVFLPKMTGKKLTFEAVDYLPRSDHDLYVWLSGIKFERENRGK